jgi:integrase/recombinase XerD
MVRYSKQDVLNEQERTELIEACQTKKEEFVIKSLLYSGMRASELAHMRESWIDWQKEVIHIPQQEGTWKPKTKSSAREIPMKFELKKVLYDYFKENKSVKMSRVTIFRVVKSLGQRLRPFKKVYPHSLRATFASNMAEKGLSAADIQAIMGWAKLETANSYVRSTKALENFREKMK